MNGTEVRKKRPRGVQEEAQGAQVDPLSPLSVSPWEQRRRHRLEDGMAICRRRPGRSRSAKVISNTR